MGESNCECSNCGHFACVCKIVADHKTWCMFRRAAAGPVGIECGHGRYVCPRCDPCTCESPPPKIHVGRTPISPSSESDNR